MKILITGGAGFVGSSVGLFLKSKYPNYDVIAFDNLKRRGSELNLPDIKGAGVEFVHGDIRCVEDLNSVDGFDVLVEASAEPSVISGLTSTPTYVVENNLYGSINCFNACLRNRAKIIFLSTSRVYPVFRIDNAYFVEEETRYSFADDQTEPGISKIGISEAVDLRGARSFYGATKLSSELFLEEYAEFYGIESAVTRFGVIAGPRQMGKTDQGVVTLWMAKHFWKGSLKYIGYGGLGKQVRDLLHIDDVVRLIDMQIHEPEKFAGKIFNAGGGLANSVSLLEMTSICEKITGNKVKVESEEQNRPADLRIYISDNTKISSDIGWEPTISVETTLSDIFDWISKNEETLRPILT